MITGAEGDQRRVPLEPRPDLRRYPRARVAWKVIVEMPGSRPRLRKTVDLSPLGAKVRLDDRLPHGAEARLRFDVPDHRLLAVKAVVGRTDADGPVFMFVGVSQKESDRLKSLVDTYRYL